MMRLPWSFMLLAALLHTNASAINQRALAPAFCPAPWLLPAQHTRRSISVRPLKLTAGGHADESAIERLDRQEAAERRYAARLQQRHAEERAGRSLHLEFTPDDFSQCPSWRSLERGVIHLFSAARRSDEQAPKTIITPPPPDAGECHRSSQYPLDPPGWRAMSRARAMSCA